MEKVNSLKDEKVNSLKDLMEFFSCPGRPVTAAEFQKFWKSCSDADKAYFKSAPLN